MELPPAIGLRITTKPEALELRDKATYLRHTVYVGLREDKPAHQVRRER